MRREVLFDAVQRIVKDITETGVLAMFEAGMDASRKRQASESKTDRVDWVSFDVFQSLSVRFAGYTENEQLVLEIMELELLTTPKYWAGLGGRSPSQIWEMQKRVQFAIESLPRLLKLIRNNEISLIKGDEQDLPKSLQGKDIVSVILTDHGEMMSSPDRIIKLLNAVSTLYKVHARLLGVSGEDLAVIGCDSGSEKSFDFLGMAAAIQGLRQTMVDIYDRRLLGRQRQMQSNLELIGQSLPILEEIRQMSEKGTISPQESELLKRQVIQGATKFLASGAITEEMSVAHLPSARALMRPEQKLLAAPTETPKQSIKEPHEASDQQGKEAGPNSEEADLTDDAKEVLRLRAEISRLRKAKKPASSRQRTIKPTTRPK